MQTLPVLQSDRIKLRKLEVGDAVSLQKNADDELVWRNLFEGFPSPYTLADALAWCTEGAHDPKMGYVWGIELDGHIVGCISVMQNKGWLRCNAELGYWIGRKYWGQGVTTEAVGLTVGWAEAHFKEVTRFYAPIFSWNIASQKVLQKIVLCKRRLCKRVLSRLGR